MSPVTRSTVMAATIMVMVMVMTIRTVQRTVTRGILMDRAWRSTASYC